MAFSNTVLCCDTDFRVCCLLLCISVLPGIPLSMDHNMKEIGNDQTFCSILRRVGLFLRSIFGASIERKL